MVRRERALRRLAADAGWHLTRTGSGHWRPRNADGATVIASFSLRSDDKQLLLAEMKRAARHNGKQLQAET